MKSTRSFQKLMRAVASGHFPGKSAGAIIDPLSIQNPWNIFVDPICACGRLFCGIEKHEVGPLPAGGKGIKCFLKWFVVLPNR